MAIVCRRRSTPHPLAGRSTAEDGGGATFLPREEWAKPRGRKSIRRRCGSGDRGAAVLRLDQPRRGRGSAPKQHPQEKTWLTEMVLRKTSGRPGEEREAVA